MSSSIFNKKPVWQPNEKSGHRMRIFIKSIEKKYNISFDDYWEFHKWTVDNVGCFWEEIWHFFGVISSEKYQQVVDLNIPMEECPKWFVGAKMNIAENLLKFRDDRIALIITGEEGNVERLSFKQLFQDTQVYAAALKRAGLQKGDVVACYMSNRKEAVIAMLAVTSFGAIWTGGLPTLGPKAYLNRIKQVNPKFLFSVDQFRNSNKKYNLLENLKEITEGLPTLEKVIIVPSKPESKFQNISEIKDSCFLDDFLQTAYAHDGTIPELMFEQVSFSHPVFINYTSGTTGLPKTIVHGFGGLLSAVRDFCLHWNNEQNDVWLTMSPVGWVSWNFLIYLLFTGSTLALFEGVPYFVTPSFFWDMIDELKITRVFMTPSVMDEMEALNYLPTERHDLQSLNMVLAGSSVVKPNNYLFALTKIKKELIFAVGCGSTETMGFHMVTDHTLSLFIGEISSASLGVAVECLDDKGNPLLGEMGEFVISKSMPSLPLFLWGDTEGVHYRKTYFSKFSGKFTLGDSIIINPITKGIIVCGRSDETLKQRGCRFGSSEIYNVVKSFAEIADSLCVGQSNKNRDERAVLFVQMKDGQIFTEKLIQKLRIRIAEELTEKHVPELILQAPGIPYNANGKKTEIIVKKIINKIPHNSEVIVNPECLNFFYDLPELQGF